MNCSFLLIMHLTETDSLPRLAEKAVVSRLQLDCPGSAIRIRTFPSFRASATGTMESGTVVKVCVPEFESAHPSKQLLYGSIALQTPRFEKR